MIKKRRKRRVPLPTSMISGCKACSDSSIGSHRRENCSKEARLSDIPSRFRLCLCPATASGCATCAPSTSSRRADVGRASAVVALLFLFFALDDAFLCVADLRFIRRLKTHTAYPRMFG